MFGESCTLVFESLKLALRGHNALHDLLLAGKPKLFEEGRDGNQSSFPMFDHGVG